MKLVILGGKESGTGAALLGQKLGYDVFLSDKGVIEKTYKEELNKAGIPFEEGQHTAERIYGADLVVKSPGIPDTVPLVAELRNRGTEVISEIEFAGRHTEARMICITGSNGKTTTTLLTHHILKQAGLDVGLAGNVGASLAAQVAVKAHPVYVVELSSFQLDGMFRFRADIGVLTNITPDHLDRYDHSFAKYAAAKMRIAQNQRAGDYFIYSADDETIWSLLPSYRLPQRQLPFAARAAVAGSDGDAFLSRDGRFTAAVGDRSVEIDTRRMRIGGLHNAYNAMAAALAALAAGVAPDRIRRSIYAFAPVEHRLEPVRETDGVLWINDSKATNVDSVWYALESMKRPVVWIAGGTDKGNDYEPLKAFAREKVHTLVCMGVDNRKLVESFTGVVPEVISTASLDEAMEAARRAARPGDAVLLSPACASFDLFRNYEQRGELFKKWVGEHC